MTFNDHDPIGIATRRELEANRSSEAEERAVCLLAETSLRLAYSGAPVVAPAPGRLAPGVLDVTLTWALDVAPPLVVRVVITDELARAAWRAASIAIGDAVRAALVERHQKRGKQAT